MGGSRNWFKTLLGLKKSAKTSHSDKQEYKNKSNDMPEQVKCSSEKDEACIDLETRQNQPGISSVPNANSESNAAPVRASAVVDQIATFNDRLKGSAREESAAIYIQTAFRGLLARKALRALKGLVRLQALVRGQAVRKQAAMTMRCMQALVRVQAQVRARRACMAMESYVTQQRLDHQLILDEDINKSELGWCDSLGSVEEIQQRMRQRQEAAAKRERAMSYAFSHQWRASSRTVSEQMGSEPDKTNLGWKWLELWMASQPWENQVHSQGKMDGLESICSNNLEQSFAGTPAHSHSRSRSSGNAKECPVTVDPRAKRRLSMPSPEKPTTGQKNHKPQQKINQNVEGKKPLKKSGQQSTKAGQVTRRTNRVEPIRVLGNNANNGNN